MPDNNMNYQRSVTQQYQERNLVQDRRHIRKSLNRLATSESTSSENSESSQCENENDERRKRSKFNRAKDANYSSFHHQVRLINDGIDGKCFLTEYLKIKLFIHSITKGS